ncbi:MAG: bacterial Ig-like domain-containing protein, partial [Clostridia bacterium]|nr:bacterial Ig-like domain-containing protein [Clostridia bacterium]
VKMKVFSVPDKVVYNVGEELNVEGLIVAVYLPNKRLEWYYDDFCTISCDDFSTTGTKTVTLTYLGVSTTFTVTVQNGGEAPLPTTTDMVRLMRALLGEEEISASADYNADGTVDVRDLVRAKKILAE